MTLNAHEIPFSQHPYPCRLEWGPEGARQAAARRDVVVVVDTLRFSTAVITAAHYDALVYPYGEGEEAAVFARRVEADLAGLRGTRFSLSPLSFRGVEPGKRVILPSINGGACCCLAMAAPCVMAGALVNASAVAAAVETLVAPGRQHATIVACGERWANSDSIRFAVEDYLAAGAIISRLSCAKSPDALVCEAAFTAMKQQLEPLLWDCDSGRELRERGLVEDVRHAARLDIYQSIPMLRGERFEKLAL